MSSVSTRPSASPPDLSWPLLLAIWTVVIGALALLTRNVYYIEGEIAEGMFGMITGALGIISLLIGLRRRRLAVWCVVLIGGALLLWLCAHTRKWALIHEDVVSVVQFAEKAKRETGRYPASLDDHIFQHPWVRDHILSFETLRDGELHVLYSMNGGGTLYWYSSKTGFHYHPD